MNYYIGIDPGKAGGIAVISQDLSYSFAWRYPGDLDLAMDLLYNIHITRKEVKLAAVEQVHSMPNMGVVGCFKFGGNYYAWLAGLSMLKIPYITVTSRKWQKAMLDAGTGETKEKSLSMARRLFPEIDMKYKKDDGMADALHLARWARRESEE